MPKLLIGTSERSEPRVRQEKAVPAFLASRSQSTFISTQKEKSYIIISVKDNGIGIQQDKYKDVFSKYNRVSDAVEGSGIGLYLVNEIVTNSCGKIVLKSEPEKGSLFMFTLWLNNYSPWPLF